MEDNYITKSTILNSPWNKNLTKDNFMYMTDSPTRLKDLNGTWLVLFYGEDNDSIEFLKKWSKLSHDVVGPDFGSCNLRVEHELAKMFYNDQGNMLVSRKRLPYIISYKNTWPGSVFDDKIDKLEAWITSVLMINVVLSDTHIETKEKPIILPNTL